MNKLMAIMWVTTALNLAAVGLTAYTQHRVADKVKVLDEQFVLAEAAVKDAEYVSNEYRGMIKRLKTSGCK